MKQERYLIRHRKAFIDNTMLGILAVATILVFSIFVYKAYVNFRDKMTVQSCKNSIDAHTAITTLSAREFFTDIKCPTKEITIKNEKDTKQIMAEDMHRCWYIWGQGRGQYFNGEGTYCQVCGIYEFGDKGQEVDGFMEYLRTQPIKNKYPGDTQGISYQDYFAGYTTPQSASMVDKKIDDISSVDVINTSQRYATIFVYASGKSFISQALEGKKAGVMATGGIFVIGGTAATVAGTTGLMASFGTAVAVGAVNAWNPVGWVILGGAGLVSLGIGAASIYTAIFAAKDPEWVSFITFRPYNNETLDNIGCEKLYVNQMSNVGKR